MNWSRFWIATDWYLCFAFLSIFLHCFLFFGIVILGGRRGIVIWQYFTWCSWVYWGAWWVWEYTMLSIFSNLSWLEVLYCHIQTWFVCKLYCILVYLLVWLWGIRKREVSVKGGIHYFGINFLLGSKKAMGVKCINCSLYLKITIIWSKFIFVGKWCLTLE